MTNTMINRLLIVFFAWFGLGAESLAQDSVQSLCQGELLVPRYGLTAASDGRWVYVYGGAPSGGRNGADFMHQGLHASIERVNPHTLKAEYFSSGLHRRANHATAFLGNRLISCGGRSQVGLNRPKISSCEYLNLDTGIFRELAPLPVAVRTLGMAAIEGDLFVAGGVLDGPDYSNGTYRLVKSSRNWERLADAPAAFSGSIVPLGRELYVLGGYDGKAMKSVMVFNTESLSWKKKKDLPYPLSAYSAVTDKQSIYIFGDYVMMDKIHRYDTETGDLYMLEQKIIPRRHTAAVATGGRVLILGGNQSSAGRSLTVIEAFDLSELRALTGRVLTDKE